MKATWSFIRRFGPVMFVIAGLAVVVAMDWHQFFTLSALADYRTQVTEFVDMNLGRAAVIFIAVYAVTVALSIPTGAFLTIASGFLFGIWMGGVLSVIGATLGAVGLFTVAKTAAGQFLQARVRNFITKLESDFDDNAFYYLLMLRFIPVVPFWILNVAPAFIGVSMPIFFWSTFIGIIPGCFVFAWVGTGLGSVLSDMADPNIADLITPDLLMPLFALGVLSVLPIIYQKMTGHSPPGIDVEDPGPDIELDDQETGNNHAKN